MSATTTSHPSRMRIYLARCVLISVHPACDADRPTLLQASFVDDAISGPIRDVFLKHASQHSLCLYLQRRHHTVSVGEAIVKVEGTAHLMSRQAVEDIVSLGNKLVPTTWMASGDKVLPMEFAVVPARYVVFLQQFLFSASWLTSLDSPHQG